MCEGEVGMDDVFGRMKEIHQKSFQDLGGEYIERDGDEKTCAIRLPPAAFFEVVSGFGLARKAGWNARSHTHTQNYLLSTYVPMQGHPPQHRHFQDESIPAHIMFAYKQGATIVKNDDFYSLPDGKNKTIDVLFLIASAPVTTGALPESGSGSYVGLALTMELAMNELAEKFPAFFPGNTKPSNNRKM